AVFNAETARMNNLYRTELDWMRRQPQARATKAKSRIDRFYEIEQRAKMRREERNVKLAVKATYLGSKIFEAKYISKSYGDLKILDQFYYNFARYEKMGIVGKNGTGKSTFLKMLLGMVKPDSGSFDIGETVSFGYYSQDGLQFDEQKKVIDVVRDIAEEIDLGGGKKMSASQFLQHFLFTPETQYNYVYKLSGGEKRRLYLCTVLMQNPNFLVLDEPTNDLDIATMNVLEDYLCTFKGCVIVVSHDRYFMDKVVDHLLVFNGDAKIKDFPGNYTDYREWRDLEEEEQREQAKQQEKKTAPKPVEEKDRPRKITYKEKKELEALDIEIPQLEEEKANIETQLSSGTLSAQEITSLSKRYEELTTQIDEKTMRWLELSEI
ncbi:MAG: ATP-binding cassette domain-containing protein, partial [Coprobacter sp.]|nr:ATP-binding cassette domain-containing protein [Coprobacter sp.]